MVILGIHDGHNASAALIINGKLICALGEERLSRDKHQYGFPSKAIEAVLKFPELQPMKLIELQCLLQHCRQHIFILQEIQL